MEGGKGGVARKERGMGGNVSEKEREGREGQER